MLDRLVAELGPTVFVKPANMGSSIGVSKATGIDELRAALDDALQLRRPDGRRGVRRRP